MQSLTSGVSIVGMKTVKSVWDHINASFEPPLFSIWIWQLGLDRHCGETVGAGVKKHTTVH